MCNTYSFSRQEWFRERINEQNLIHILTIDFYEAVDLTSDCLLLAVRETRRNKHKTHNNLKRTTTTDCLFHNTFQLHMLISNDRITA